jgi:hypothetical protein
MWGSGCFESQSRTASAWTQRGAEPRNGIPKPIPRTASAPEQDQGRQGETTFVGRHVVNAPSELSAGIVGGAEQTFVRGMAANTPSELNQPSWSSPPASRHKVMSDTLGSNTPTELSGGIISGLPAKFYDRHQRG